MPRSETRAQTVGLVLAGDATELLLAQVRDTVEELGVPPVGELLAKARQHDLPIYVGKGCAVARGATEEDLGQRHGPPG